MTWSELDWSALDRLRDGFLSGKAAHGAYWQSASDLASYDFTYGERIGWKWDAVLRELKARSWTPGSPARQPVTIFDWGCGSGIAGRRVIEAFGAANFSRLILHDHSTLALDYAEHHGRRTFPGLTVERATTRDLRGDEPIGLLVVSHVVNELNDAARAELAELCARARTILWVEPGTHEASRLLGAWREQLREQFHAVAPCPHRAACGVLAPGNERHWCHFFASPPPGLYADSGWVKFGQRAGIDLRSLPYSYLVLERNSVAEAGDRGDDTRDGHTPPLQPSRIIGHAKVFKGYAKVFACDATGVHDLMLQKRDDPVLFKALKQGTAASLRRWTHENGRITRIESAAGPGTDYTDDHG